MADTTAYKLAVIGCGAMGSGIIAGITEAQMIAPERIIGADIASVRLEHVAAFGIATTDDHLAAAEAAEVVMLAVKPQVIDEILQSISGVVADRLVVSIAAGVPLSRYEKALGGDCAIVRVMPNVLCTVGEAASAYAANGACTPEQMEFVDQMLNTMGAAVAVEEKLMDAVTGLSGSGPAFVAVFAEALIDGGVAAGLPRAQAEKLAAQTILGVGMWLSENGGSPAALKDMVTSPGGTTIAGIRALEQGGLRAATIDAVVAATERSRELGS